ncbi:MAG TPA: hypothetical protein VGH67_04500 [Solirubrobacteraceae bacterium]|jgi:hypothetical protein
MPAPAVSHYHDVRKERVGSFAGARAVEPAAPFGKFAGPPRRRWQAAGGFAGAPDRQRQGSFADMQVGRRRRPT